MVWNYYIFSFFFGKHPYILCISFSISLRDIGGTGEAGVLSPVLSNELLDKLRAPVLLAISLVGKLLVLLCGRLIDVLGGGESVLDLGDVCVKIFISFRATFRNFSILI